MVGPKEKPLGATCGFGFEDQTLRRRPGGHAHFWLNKTIKIKNTFYQCILYLSDRYQSHEFSSEFRDILKFEIGQKWPKNACPYMGDGCMHQI